jgi:two-component system NarL family sensor kinase
VVALIIVPLYVVGICTAYLLKRSAGLPQEHLVEDIVLPVGFGAFAVVGSLLVAKRPTNLIGWIMAAVALMVGIFHAGDTYAAFVMVTYGHPDALATVSAWVGTWYWSLLLALALIYLPLLFPDGRLLSRRWIPVAVLPGIGTLSIVTLGALAESLPVNEAPGYGIENP